MVDSSPFLNHKYIFYDAFKMVLGEKKKIRLTQKRNAEDEKTPMDNLPGNCWAQIFKHSVQLWKNLLFLKYAPLFIVYDTDGCRMKCPSPDTPLLIR